jgi:hypothetical protein
MKMRNAPRQRLFDQANQHLDDPTDLQAGIDLQLNRLPLDHAFHHLSLAELPSMSDVAVLTHVRQLGWLSRMVSSAYPIGVTPSATGSIPGDE